MNKLEQIIANVWFGGEFTEDQAKESVHDHDLDWSVVEAEYGRQYEEMERLSHG